MNPDLKAKDLPYIIMIIAILVSVVVMMLDKLDICLGLFIFMASLVLGLAYLMFFETDS